MCSFIYACCVYFDYQCIMLFMLFIVAYIGATDKVLQFRHLFVLLDIISETTVWNGVVVTPSDRAYDNAAEEKTGH